jgi:hypothetical protein
MSISKTANGEDAQKGVEPTMDPPDMSAFSNGVESSSAAMAGEEILKQRQESSLARADVSKKKLCGVCDEKEGKYKCSRCYLPS